MATHGRPWELAAAAGRRRRMRAHGETSLVVVNGALLGILAVAMVLLVGSLYVAFELLAWAFGVHEAPAVHHWVVGAVGVVVWLWVLVRHAPEDEPQLTP